MTRERATAIGVYDELVATIDDLSRGNIASTAHACGWKISWVPRSNSQGDLCAVDPAGNKHFSVASIQRILVPELSIFSPPRMTALAESGDSAELSVEEFVAASADHQDSVFRLVQYACKLLGSFYSGQRRPLHAVASNVDASRALMRSFGIVYALQELRTSRATGLGRLSELSLVAYHPLETLYWLLEVTAVRGAPWRPSWRRAASRLVSALGLLYAVCGAHAAYQRLRELREAQEIMLVRAEGAEAAAAAGASAEAASDAAEARDEAGGELAGAIATARSELWKLGIDALMSLNWAVDHPSLCLADWHVGALGMASAWLGLNLKWSAHVQALQLEGADDDEEDDDGGSSRRDSIDSGDDGAGALWRA